MNGSCGLHERRSKDGRLFPREPLGTIRNHSLAVVPSGLIVSKPPARGHSSLQRAPGPLAKCLISSIVNGFCCIVLSTSYLAYQPLPP